MSTQAASFQSFSVPTSPATARASKGQPVTPQRLPRHQHRHSQSAYRSPNTPSTPYTPLSLRSSDSTGSSTLTTPDNVSILMKKRLATGRSPEVHRNSSMDNGDSKDQSLADLAQNWRARASQHGIKVSSSNSRQDESQFGDDEGSDKTSSDLANDSSILSTDEALLPPPFLSYHRRSLSQTAATRPRALSHASLPENRTSLSLSPSASRNANCTMPLTSSPVRSRRALGSLNQATNIMCTPPPNRSLSAQLKLKGSLTDPAQTRRREAFGSAPMLSNSALRGNASMTFNLNNNASLELFNINEHDFECENDQQDAEEVYDESFSLDLQNHTANIFGFPSNLEHGHKQAFSSSNLFADPFNFFESNPSVSGNHVLNSIAESVEHHFHTMQPPPTIHYPTPNYFPAGQSLFNQHATQALAKPVYSLPPTVLPIPMPHGPMGVNQNHTSTSTFSVSPSLSVRDEGVSTPAASPSTEPPTDCSVCLVSRPSSLAILQPCHHPLCSGCLTSALNIVGEKDMECAVCKNKVADFKLVTVKKLDTKAKNGTKSAKSPVTTDPFDSDKDVLAGSRSHLEPRHELESAFELGFDLHDLRASTPKFEQQTTREGHDLSSSTSSGCRELKKHDGNVVLRIDNVPWDITPKQISNWLQQPVERVHVLLDHKGKTLSHAYVEVNDAAIAGAILRGETTQANSAGKKERGSVLGKGKRARGVTITRSSQEELMANLFPSWRGTFNGSRPSLAGLEGDGIILALECGFITEGEINALRHLIQEPDSHFLKVPVLPFHSLLSILSKFPTDLDSRVFWSSTIRDNLFDVAYAAIQALFPRVEKAAQHDEHTIDLIMDIAHTAMSCKAFTPHQIRKIADLMSAHSLPVMTMELSSLLSESSGTSSEQASTPNVLRTPNDHQPIRSNYGKELGQRASVPFDDLAREFGVEAQLVQALAHRLAALS